MTRGATISAALIPTILLTLAMMPVVAQAAGDESSDFVDCSAPYIPQCGCGKVMNPQTKQCEDGKNSYECSCKQTDNGAVNSGTCVAQNLCKANNTNGSKPSQVTSQQEQQATPPNSPSQSGASNGSNPSPANTSGSNPSPSVTPSVEPASTPSGEGSSASGESSPNSQSGQSQPPIENSLQDLQAFENPNTSSQIPSDQSLLQDMYQTAQQYLNPSSELQPSQETGASGGNTQGPSVESTILNSGGVEGINPGETLAPGAGGGTPGENSFEQPGQTYGQSTFNNSGEPSSDSGGGGLASINGPSLLQAAANAWGDITNIAEAIGSDVSSAASSAWNAVDNAFSSGQVFNSEGNFSVEATSPPEASAPTETPAPQQYPGPVFNETTGQWEGGYVASSYPANIDQLDNNTLSNNPSGNLSGLSEYLQIPDQYLPEPQEIFTVGPDGQLYQPGADVGNGAQPVTGESSAPYSWVSSVSTVSVDADGNVTVSGTSLGQTGSPADLETLQGNVQQWEVAYDNTLGSSNPALQSFNQDAGNQLLNAQVQYSSALIDQIASNPGFPDNPLSPPGTSVPQTVQGIEGAMAELKSGTIDPLTQTIQQTADELNTQAAYLKELQSAYDNTLGIKSLQSFNTSVGQQLQTASQTYTDAVNNLYQPDVNNLNNSIAQYNALAQQLQDLPDSVKAADLIQQDIISQQTKALNAENIIESYEGTVQSNPNAGGDQQLQLQQGQLANAAYADLDKTSAQVATDENILKALSAGDDQANAIGRAALAAAADGPITPGTPLTANQANWQMLVQSINANALAQANVALFTPSPGVTPEAFDAETQAAIASGQVLVQGSADLTASNIAQFSGLEPLTPANQSIIDGLTGATQPDALQSLADGIRNWEAQNPGLSVITSFVNAPLTALPNAVGDPTLSDQISQMNETPLQQFGGRLVDVGTVALGVAPFISPALDGLNALAAEGSDFSRVGLSNVTGGPGFWNEVASAMDGIDTGAEAEIARLSGPADTIIPPTADLGIDEATLRDVTSQSTIASLPAIEAPSIIPTEGEPVPTGGTGVLTEPPTVEGEIISEAPAPQYTAADIDAEGTFAKLDQLQTELDGIKGVPSDVSSQVTQLEDQVTQAQAQAAQIEHELANPTYVSEPVSTQRLDAFENDLSALPQMINDADAAIEQIRTASPSDISSQLDTHEQQITAVADQITQMLNDLFPPAPPQLPAVAEVTGLAQEFSAAPELPNVSAEDQLVPPSSAASAPGGFLSKLGDLFSFFFPAAQSAPTEAPAPSVEPTINATQPTEAENEQLPANSEPTIGRVPTAPTEEPSSPPTTAPATSPAPAFRGAIATAALAAALSGPLPVLVQDPVEAFLSPMISPITEAQAAKKISSVHLPGTSSVADCLRTNCIASSQTGPASRYELTAAQNGGVSNTTSSGVTTGPLIASQTYPYGTVGKLCNGSSCMYVFVGDTGSFDQPLYHNTKFDASPQVYNVIGPSAAVGRTTMTFTPLLIAPPAQASAIATNLNNKTNPMSLAQAVTAAKANVIAYAPSAAPTNPVQAANNAFENAIAKPMDDLLKAAARLGGTLPAQAPATSAPAPAKPAATVPQVATGPAPTYAFGDSYCAGLGLKGVCVSGATSAKILQNVQSFLAVPANANKLIGQNVLVTTGAPNAWDKGQTTLGDMKAIQANVPQILQALKNAVGPTGRVIVVGPVKYGPFATYQSAFGIGLDQALANMAQQAEVQYASIWNAPKDAPNGYHPASGQIVIAAVEKAEAATLPQQKTPSAVANQIPSSQPSAWQPAPAPAPQFVPSVQGVASVNTTLQYSSLAAARADIAQQLQDPQVRRLLMASIDAEVGGQGALAAQAYTESVMNRAVSRGMTLQDTVTALYDPSTESGYYPATTINKLGQTFSPKQQAYFNGIINKVLDGSNVSNLATGNESGKNICFGTCVSIRFNPGTGERFVLESPDAGWFDNAQATLGQTTLGTVPPARTASVVPQFTPLPTPNWSGLVTYAEPEVTYVLTTPSVPPVSPLPALSALAPHVTTSVQEIAQAAAEAESGVQSVENPNPAPETLQPQVVAQNSEAPSVSEGSQPVSAGGTAETPPIQAENTAPEGLQPQPVVAVENSELPPISQSSPPVTLPTQVAESGPQNPTLPQTSDLQPQPTPAPVVAEEIPLPRARPASAPTVASNEPVPAAAPAPAAAPEPAVASAPTPEANPAVAEIQKSIADTKAEIAKLQQSIKVAEAKLTPLQKSLHSVEGAQGALRGLLKGSEVKVGQGSDLVLRGIDAAKSVIQGAGNTGGGVGSLQKKIDEVEAAIKKYSFASGMTLPDKYKSAVQGGADSIAQLARGVVSAVKTSINNSVAPIKQQIATLQAKANELQQKLATALKPPEVAQQGTPPSAETTPTPAETTGTQVAQTEPNATEEPSDEEVDVAESNGTTPVPSTSEAPVQAGTVQAEPPRVASVGPAPSPVPTPEPLPVAITPNVPSLSEETSAEGEGEPTSAGTQSQAENSLPVPSRRTPTPNVNGATPPEVISLPEPALSIELADERPDPVTDPTGPTIAEIFPEIVAENNVVVSQTPTPETGTGVGAEPQPTVENTPAVNQPPTTKPTGPVASEVTLAPQENTLAFLENENGGFDLSGLEGAPLFMPETQVYEGAAAPEIFLGSDYGQVSTAAPQTALPWGGLSIPFVLGGAWIEGNLAAGGGASGGGTIPPSGGATPPGGTSPGGTTPPGQTPLAQPSTGSGGVAVAPCPSGVQSGGSSDFPCNSNGAQPSVVPTPVPPAQLLPEIPIATPPASPPAQTVPTVPTAQPETQSQPLSNVPLPPTRPRYSGPSIVDFLNSLGANFSYAARATLAASLGIANYVGSAAQNLQLLRILRGF